MSQQINLLNPSLIKQKNFLNPNTIVITLGILLVLMTTYFSYAEKQLLEATAQRNKVAEQLITTQELLKQTTLLHTPHEMNKALSAQIAQLEEKETMQNQILKVVKQSSATPENGYAALMRAFAKQSLDGLWLTSVSIDSQTQQLNISGRTLQADLVPEYISRLGNEPALKGKLFSALNMNLPKNEASHSETAAAVSTAPSSISTAPSIIKNGIATAPSNTSTVEKNKQNNEVSYIEFSLQSVDDKSVTITTDNKAGEKL